MMDVRRRLRIFLGLFLMVAGAGTVGFMALEGLSFVDAFYYNSEALLAIFHLTEELDSREDFKRLPPSDLKHLSGDIHRSYRLLVDQWIVYLKHLQGQYPYLYSLAVRNNPLNPAASKIVTE